MKYFIVILLVTLSAIAKKSNTDQIDNFNAAKKYLAKHLDLYSNQTIYCSCKVEGKKVDIKSCGYKVQHDAKRAGRLEWEHVVPAEAFGQSFAEWRVGTPACIKKGKQFKGRKCADKNSEFNKIESDLYNLFPEIGELNGLRSNYSMAEIQGNSDGKFGKCSVQLKDRKFEPQELSKGVVARAYLNLENRYPGRGIVSEKNRPLFEAWDKLHPVTDLECKRWKVFEPVNRYKHLFASRCEGTK